VKKLFYLFIILVFNIELSAQAFNETDEDIENESRNIVAFSVGYTYVPKGTPLEASERKGFFVPSVGLDYYRKIGEKFELGVMMDWELDHYIIFDRELERERAVMLIVSGSYSLLPKLNAIVGGGIELERHENLAVFRLGLEKTFRLSDRLYLGIPFLFDIKKGFDTWSLSTSLIYEF